MMQQRIIYIYGNFSHANHRAFISMFDIDTQKLNDKICAESVSLESYIIFADDNLHVIGGQQDDSYMHLIYNKDTKEFNEHWTFQDFTYHHWGGLVYVKSKYKMLLFGGFEGSDCINTDNIYEYSFADKKWSILDAKLPIRCSSFGFILTPDDKYIIIFGGWDQHRAIDDIYIWEIDRMIFRKCRLKCPVKSQYRACIMMDEVLI